ncbi:hypothetical protein UFOVP191_64 [uncultured Caudovirales phage]|uniref:Uncharacterized protein n=1 Tax=uncultured Caudovirales phage TaxID=2100421 RepID=A0A6J7WGN5_9CAUD|nr:hypothetical protein UFOVP191_64 [uncultured Caudovirales phage]
MENSQMDMNQDQMQGAPMENAPQDNAADAGRGTDNTLAHMTLGEIVLPLPIVSDQNVMQAIAQAFQAAGLDINQYTVGHESNTINPETGYPEFGFGKFLKKAAGIVLPNLGAVGGFANGLIQGDGLGGALKQGLGSGLTAAASIYGGPIAGAAAGGINAKLNGGNPLYGAIGGGLSGALSGGSLDGMFGNLATNTASDALPWQTGSGLLGKVSGATGLTSGSIPSLGGILGSTGSGSSGGGSSFGLNTLGSALGGLQQDSALKKQKQQLLAAQGQQLGNLENLNPTDVQNDPGYQFNLAQGQEGLNRSLGAQGGLFSGNALKAASQYNQDFANNYYNQAYQRQAAKVGAQNDIYGNTGNINANATLGQSNNINQTLANALGANVGAYNGANNNISTADLLALMKQRGLA